MHNISEATRQNILDIIKDGFIIPLDEPAFDFRTEEFVTERTIKISFNGTLDIIQFLQRIYDLAEMPSTDSRFENALEDIQCHLKFSDYPNPCWFFWDKRFRLCPGDGDEPLLKFLCEMLHPAVRNEKGDWKQYLRKFNELLRKDGYELYPMQYVSGKDMYQARLISPIVQHDFPECLFSEHYKNLIIYNQEKHVDNISGAVEEKAKKHLCKIMEEFSEPACKRLSRYDAFTIRTDALKQAIQRLIEYINVPIVDATTLNMQMSVDINLLSACFTPFLFDIIELQYDELSTKEKVCFQ